MKPLAFLLFPLLTIGCAVIKETDRPNVNRLDKDNYLHLNGTYLNHGKDTTGTQFSFWSQIGGHKNLDLTKNGVEQTIGLEFVSKRKLQVALYENGSFIKQKKIRGKIKDGYFYKRPIFILYPLVPIFFGYRTHRSRFGLIDKNLVLDKKEHYWVCSFGFGETSIYQISGTFEKK